ncbi:MAG: hypothetical protein RQ754_02965 [Desulfuromonadales bacterium]|nr:hypothetical protein [Desulfuromonadales bacterium]
MNLHPRTRQIQLAEQVVTEILTANEAKTPFQAKRALKLAIATAQEYERERQIDMAYKERGREE